MGGIKTHALQLRSATVSLELLRGIAAVGELTPRTTDYVSAFGDELMLCAASVQVGPGSHEGLDIALGFHDHEVDVQEQARALPDGLEHGRPQRDIGHEASIHHVHVELIGATGLDARDGLSQEQIGELLVTLPGGLRKMADAILEFQREMDRPA